MSTVFRLVGYSSAHRVCRLRPYKRFFNDDKFMEEDLARAVKRKRPFYAIGMTKEVFSPVGATRVYVDDENWKEGALKLIRDSTYIVILLDTRESCLWEILQCKDIKDKVLCICENFKKYEEVRSKTKEILCLPKIYNHDNSHNCFSFILYDPVSTAKPYYPSFRGNNKLVDEMENIIVGK